MVVNLSEVDRNAAADSLAEVLQSQTPADVWGAALVNPQQVSAYVRAHGGADALDRFAVRDVPTDKSTTEPGRVLQKGEATPAGHAFVMLLEVACDALHTRATAVGDVDRAVLIGGLRGIAAGQFESAERLAAKLARIEELLVRLPQPSRVVRWSGPIRIGEDAWPREAEAFVPRPELDKIRKTLASESTVTICQLNGMRGVGKSQLAAAYARECDAAGYDVVAWIDARSRESVVANMARLVAAYAPEDPDENPEVGIKRLLDRFGSAPDERRLIVFDNVERYADLGGARPADVHTKLVVTTTLTSGVLGARPIRDSLLHEEGGDYPLGAAQAIDLAIETVLTTTDDAGNLCNAPLRADAEAVLDALALLADTGVPRAWLRALGDEFRIDDAVAALVGSSLAEYSEDKSSVRLHRLTRRVYAEERLGEDDARERARRAAVTALASGLPHEDEPLYAVRRAGLEPWLAYLASTLSDVSPVLRGPAFVSVADALGPDHPNTLTSRNNLAIALWQRGDRRQAYEQMGAAAEHAGQVLSESHPLAQRLADRADAMRVALGDAGMA